MEWILAALLFVLAGNGPDSPDQGSPSVSAPQEQGSASIMAGGGGFPPPKKI